MKTLAFLLMISLAGGAAFAQSPPAQASEQKVIAVVLGKKITVKDKDRLKGLIFGTLLEQFAKENRIEPTDEEIDTFIQKNEEIKQQQNLQFKKKREQLIAELKDPNLTQSQRKEKQQYLETLDKVLKSNRETNELTKKLTQEQEEQLRPMLRRMARQFVRRWKINKALFAKYGGRVIFQQAGVEPLDAYRDFLQEQEKNGAFRILDPKYKAPFWRYFTNDAMHSFYAGDDGAKFINTPWWLMEPQE